MEIRYKIEGAKEFGDNLENMARFVVEEAKRAVYFGALAIGTYAANNHPYQDRKGLNTASIFPNPVKVGTDAIECSTGPHTEYGRYLEEGTRHEGSGSIMGKYFGGGYRTKPYPYMKPALDASEALVVSILSNVLPRAKARAGL